MIVPKFIEDRVWAGSEASLKQVLADQDIRAARIAAGTYTPREEEDRPSRLLEVEDGVAVLSISGPLVNDDDALWNQMTGKTGYPEIQAALVEAAMDPEVKHVLLNIDSGGGQVSGVEDTGNLIRQVQQVKPVTTYSGGNMYSAAYWLGSTAGEVHAAKGTGVGSIGVIATHMEQSERLKMDGIGVTVIRAGKYKALTNSVEKLSDEGKAIIEADVQAAYKDFVNHVADSRGKSYEYTDTVMAQGREFRGQAAVEVGLVDSITTFDAVVSNIKEKLMDTSKSFMDNRGKQSTALRVETHGDGNSMPKKTLTEADIAALAAGASLDASASNAQPAEEPKDDAAVKPEVSAEVGKDEAEGEKAEVKAESKVEEKVDASASTLKFMADQLKAAQDELFAARLALSKLEDKHADLAAVVGPLKDIAAKAINNMRVALNSSPMDFSALGASQILADHTAMAANFESKFKVGGVAAVEVAVEPKGSKKTDALTQARLNAVRF